MNKAGTSLVATLAALGEAAAAAQAVDFPCARLNDGGTRIYEAIGPRIAAKSASPVRLKRNAVLADDRHDLQTRWRTPDDTALSTDGGTARPLAFRTYRIANMSTPCTSMSRDTLFGPRNRDGSYALRCLFDTDGDGLFDAFRAHGELVSYNSRTGAIGKAAVTAPPTRPLPKPMRLADGGTDPSPDFAPKVLSRIRVGKLTKDSAELIFASGVTAGPEIFGGLLGRPGGQSVQMPLREGDWTGPHGARLTLTRKGGDWYASVPDGYGVPPRLQCGGSVVEVGDSFTVMTDGGMSMFSRTNLPVE